MTQQYFKKIYTLMSTELNGIFVSDEMKSKFKEEFLTPYFINLIDNIEGHFEDRGIITVLSVFDPRHLLEDFEL